MDQQTFKQLYKQGCKDFSNQSLWGLNLMFLNLSGFNFHNADLRACNLYGANLCGADLTQVNIIFANLTNVIVDSTTKIDYHERNYSSIKLNEICHQKKR